MQQQSDLTWRLLQCGSRFATPTEARYCATEIELLAVVWAVNKCKVFLLGDQFELIVDHKPLLPIINSKTLDEIDNPRLLRLKEKLAAYNIQAIWRAGKKHIVVDCFSRNPVDDPDDQDLVGEHEVEDQLEGLRVVVLLDNEDGSQILEDSMLTSLKEAGRLSMNTSDWQISSNQYSRTGRKIWMRISTHTGHVEMSLLSTMDYFCVDQDW